MCIGFLGSAYIEVIIFFLLVAYFVIHRHDQRMVVSGISMLKVIHPPDNLSLFRLEPMSGHP